MELVKKPVLENWEIITEENSENDETMRVRIRGDIYGSDEFTNGTRIITGKVEHLDIPKKFVRTFRGKMFRLGAADSEYEQFAKTQGLSMADIRVSEGFYYHIPELN